MSRKHYLLALVALSFLALPSCTFFADLAGQSADASNFSSIETSPNYGG